MDKNKDYARLTIGMSSDFKKRLRRAAASVDKNMSDFILMILKECVSRMNLDKKP